MDARTTTVAELVRRVRRGEVSARELTADTLARIEALDPALGAFVAVGGERALEQAAAVDQLVATGADPGPLAGVPLAVKDNEDAAGYRTTHGSRLFGAAPAAVRDSAQVARLRAAGCVVVGKTNLPELACSLHTANDLFGETKNPWDLDHVAGGSSGGSAAALAAGLVPLATGSDGGGSIRLPSACCGLSAMKPSIGRVPDAGPLPPHWLDLSTPAPMARTVADLVAALEVVVGPDPTDLRSLPRPEASWSAVLEDPHVPAKVAWAPTLGYAELDRQVGEVCQRGVETLERLGADVVEVEAVFDHDPVADWLTIAGTCTLRTIEDCGDHPARPEVERALATIIEAGRRASARDLVRALDACHRLNRRLVELFHDVRLLVTPTIAGVAPPIALGGQGTVNGRTTWGWAPFTYPFNMTRSPAATVCAGLAGDGLPVGLQLIGPQHADLVVLRSAAALEQALGFDQLAPFGAEPVARA